MRETLKTEWQAKVAVVIFLLLTLWWFISPKGERFFGDYGSVYGIMALWGGIWGVVISLKWGGFKSVMGRSIFFFSLGLFAQVFGQLAYAYLAFYQHIEVPYPSIGDIGYFGSIPLYILAVIFLAQAAGVKVGLKSITSLVLAILIPLAMLAVGYFLFLQGYQLNWSDSVKTFLDFGYPFGQAIYISLAILTFLLTKGVLGGVMKSKVLTILFALVIQFAADYTFLYQSSRGIWKVGEINDYMYLVAYFVMAMSLFQLQTIISKLQNQNE